MINTKKDVTIVIISHKSKKKVLNLINNISNDFKIIIIENSPDKTIESKFFHKIQKIKQTETQRLLNKNLKFNPKIFKLFSKLSKDYKICIATNAINKTLQVCLKRLKIKKFISFSFSNQDVVNNKPHPEIYLKCLIDMGLKPSETLIFEDSSHGVMAAQDSGCHLFK